MADLKDVPLSDIIKELEHRADKLAQKGKSKQPFTSIVYSQVKRVDRTG